LQEIIIYHNWQLLAPDTSRQRQAREKNHFRRIWTKSDRN